MKTSEQLESDLSDFKDHFGRLKDEIQKAIVGYDELLTDALVAIFSQGHVLLEGVPGLGKTFLVRVLSQVMDLEPGRVQCTPDLMPADITGTEVIQENKASGQREFRFLEGPIFANVILADEINRTPPKTQAALLQAMQEREVSVGQTTYDLPDPFFTIATQNPIEQEGTYPLPEAQLDRFLMHVRVGYPSGEDEKAILALTRKEARSQASDDPAPSAVIGQQSLLEARDAVLDIHLDSSLEDYIIEIVLATRSAERYGDELAGWIQHGASPRATMALDRCARAYAWLNHRDYVVPEDIQLIAPDVLRHRIILSFEAEAEGKTADSCIDAILARVAVP